MNLLIHINPADPVPLYAQLERGIRLAMAIGRLTVGEQLPTVRQMAVDLRVNANTVAKVYAELERAGLLESRRGVGTFVRAAAAPAAHEDTRRQQLGQLTDRLLMEVAALGFSLPELLNHLQSKLNLEE